MTTRKHATTTLILTAAILVAQGAAHAQDMLMIGTTAVSAARDPGQRLGTVSADLTRPLAGGGRFAVGTSDIVDLRTGRRTPIPSGVLVLAVDPIRPWVFVRENCDVAADRCDVVARHLETGTPQHLTTMAWSSSGSVLAPPLARYAADADVLFVDQGPRTLLIEPRAIRGFRASNGAPVGAVVPIQGGVWDVTPDGARIVASGEPFQTQGMKAYDVATGAVVASNTVIVEALEWNPLLDGVFTHDGRLLDRDLRETARANFDGACGGPQVAVSAHTGRIYVLDGGGSYGFYQPPHRLHILGPGAGWTSTEVDSKAGLSARSCYALTLLSPPGPPRNLQAMVTARTVSLTWLNVGAASGFVLDVGLAPGRTDLSMYLGPDARTSFAGVPPGTYYLRLRGGNEFGGGLPAPEIRVVVP